MNTWYSDGITLVNNGQDPVVDDILGVWDITSVEDGFYLVRLKATYPNNEIIEDYTEVYIERNFMNGWPLSITSPKKATTSIAS